MFDEIKRLEIKEDKPCPNCDEMLLTGSFYYKDEYRNEYCCPLCIKDYKEAVIQEEGEHGEKLK